MRNLHFVLQFYFFKLVMDAWILIILCVANTYIAILFVISPELAKTVGPAKCLKNTAPEERI